MNFPLQSWSFLLLTTLMIMKPSWKYDSQKLWRPHQTKNPFGSTPNPFNNRFIRGRGDTRHGMSPFTTVNSRVYDARGVRLFNEVLQIQGNMAGTGRTGPGMKLTGSKTFLLARSTKVHHCRRTNGLWGENRRLHCSQKIKAWIWKGNYGPSLEQINPGT